MKSSVQPGIDHLLDLVVDRVTVQERRDHAPALHLGLGRSLPQIFLHPACNPADP
jgi:hypothetical protein